MRFMMLSGKKWPRQQAAKPAIIAKSCNPGKVAGPPALKKAVASRQNHAEKSLPVDPVRGFPGRAARSTRVFPAVDNLYRSLQSTLG